MTVQEIKNSKSENTEIDIDKKTGDTQKKTVDTQIKNKSSLKDIQFQIRIVCIDMPLASIETEAFSKQVFQRNCFVEVTIYEQL